MLNARSRHLLGSGTGRLAVAVLVFAIATAVAFLAHITHFPRTAALTYVFGVTVVGAMLGLRSGLVAALVAAITYNLFLSEPVREFGVTSLDDLVPLLAFTISAIASGLIAGRLRDRAQAAEGSTSRMQALFQMSQSLQGAFDQADVVTTAVPYLTTGPVQAIEIYLHDGTQLVGQTGTGHGLSVAQSLWTSGEPELASGDTFAVALGNPRESLGVLVARYSGAVAATDELKGFVTVFSIALERCKLTQRLAQAEVLRQSEEFKTALLSSVSHDLRTPLSAIAASTTSLARFKDSLDEATKLDLLDTIQEQCDRLNRLTTNLLNLGRIQGGIVIDKMPVVDAIDILGSVLSKVRAKSGEHRFEKRIVMATAPVQSEAVMLEQMFYNVLENAVVHTSPGATILTTASRDNGWVRIAFEDSGPGIADLDRDRVFDRFFQGSGTGSRGSGLGLSIVKGFAEAIGGEVRASPPETALGGARIELILPSAADRVH